MNLILLFESDFISPSQVQLRDHRKDHITLILKSKIGDNIIVGQKNGKMGRGIIKEISPSVVMDVIFNQDPPPALPLTLVMALPRPHVFKRTLLCAASLGIKQIYVLNFNRVEKSLWNSSSLRPEVIEEQLVLGLQQAKDTMLPQVYLKDKFKPFVQDELPGIANGTIGLLAHPGAALSCPSHIKEPVTLVIGPEGGLVDFEVDLLSAQGFKPFDLGSRILRVESVLPLIVGKFF